MMFVLLFCVNVKDVIFYRKKTRLMRYELVDGASKAIMIDESKSVRKICDQIGAKIGLSSAEEFSLRMPPHSLMEEKSRIFFCLFLIFSYLVR